MLELSWGSFPVGMRFRFKHASADRREAENVIVRLVGTDGQVGYGEGCPRDYVSGETCATAFKFIAAHRSDFTSALSDLESLKKWIGTNITAIDRHPSAFAAMEIAALDWLGHRSGKSIEDLLCVSSSQRVHRYSAVEGDSAPVATLALTAAYRAFGFSDYKLKLSGNETRDRQRLSAWRAAAGPSARIRADANNLWLSADACIAHIRKLGNPFWAIEEPMKAGDFGGMNRISISLGTRIILDESLCLIDQLSTYGREPSRWIVNVRVSKMGGVLRSIDLACRARDLGIDVIIGAHVGETSILTRAALGVANALKCGPLAQEGAYGDILLKRDLAQPSLKFGRGGMLDPAKYCLADRPGLGLGVDDSAVVWAGGVSVVPSMG